MPINNFRLILNCDPKHCAADNATLNELGELGEYMEGKLIPPRDGFNLLGWWRVSMCCSTRIHVKLNLFQYIRTMLPTFPS